MKYLGYIDDVWDEAKLQKSADDIKKMEAAKKKEEDKKKADGELGEEEIETGNKQIIRCGDRECWHAFICMRGKTVNKRFFFKDYSSVHACVKAAQSWWSLM